MRKFIKIMICFVMALTLVGTSACGLFGGGGADGKTYSVTLNLNGGTLAAGDELTSYVSGEEVLLPTPTKTNETFAGWFKSSDFSGGNVVKIYSGEKGNQEFWAKWTPKSSENPDISKPTAQTYKVTLNLNGGSVAQSLTSYTKGTGATLPTPTKANNTFGGWYDNEGLNGTPVTKISESDTGDKQYWAKWTPTATGSLALSAYEGYSEGAFVEFAAQSGVNKYAVSYKKSGASTFTEIDDELIRVNGNTVRADIVGLSAGNYNVKVTAGSKSAECSVTVISYDRSGYAHFDGAKSDKMVSEGVGGYNNDGTPKTNAEIIYVTEATKNTVTASYTSKVGLVNILTETVNCSHPVIIRIVGTISAATWNKLEYNGGKAITRDKVVSGSDKSKKLEDYLIKTATEGSSFTITGSTANGEGYKDQKITQEELIRLGFNTLNTTTCTKLNNLSSTIKYSQSKDEFDSCWNDCSIGSSKGGAENVTVEGIGKDSGLFQWGMTWRYSNFIEVRNLTFDDYTEDACSFEGGTDADNVNGFDSNRIWLHNCTFNEGVNYWDVCNEQDKHDGDGSTDFKKAAYITLSYNHYIETHKTGLIGGDDAHKTANVTFHHNYYQSCKSRLPLGRQANMHMFNNYYEGTTSTCLSIRSGAYAFVENCYFKDAANPLEPVQGTKAEKAWGVIKYYNCEFNNSKIITSKEINKKTVDLTPYIIKVTDRTKTVTNYNCYNKNFDTDASAFYYDATNKVTLVDSAHPMLATADVPAQVPKLAGVLKK